MGKLDGRVALLAGGHPSEHEVSLRSGRMMAEALAEAGFGVIPVLLGMDGTWNIAGASSLESGWPVSVATQWAAATWRGTAASAALELARLGVDTVCLGLHGPNGEDGTIQGFLETVGFAYTGSGVTASAVAMDKIQSKRVAASVGLRTSAFEVLEPGDPSAGSSATRAAWADQVVTKLSLPLVIKAPILGSSVHVHIARTSGAARAAVEEVWRAGERVLVEAFVEGREFTVPVLGTGAAARPMPVIEIRPKLAGWFDAASKYTPGGADEIVPAPIPTAEALRLQEAAIRLHTAIGGAGVTRTDFIVNSEGVPFVLEINTLPGMTRESLVPRAARAMGKSMAVLMQDLVLEARTRRAARLAMRAEAG